MLTVRTHTSLVNLSMTKEVRIDKKEKTTSSIKGVGKTRELHAKKSNWRREFEDNKVEGCELTSSYKNTKITTN